MYKEVAGGRLFVSDTQGAYGPRPLLHHTREAHVARCTRIEWRDQRPEGPEERVGGINSNAIESNSEKESSRKSKKRVR